jgi:hypothetical protein
VLAGARLMSAKAPREGALTPEERAAKKAFAVEEKI